MCAKKTTEEEMKKYGLANVKPYKYAMDKAVYSLTVLVYPSLLFMTLIMINHFYELSFIAGMGYDFQITTWFMITSVFVVTIMTDTMAYVVGSTVKGPKLCPLISPNKTISGAVGGLVGGVLSGVGLYGLFTIKDAFRLEMAAIGCEWWILLAIFVLGSIMIQIGDILASALKRRARVKDYGTIFPGHGGIMDRMDGNIFNAFLSLVAFMLIFLV
jgi:CDP-diglyceride synthetase